MLSNRLALGTAQFGLSYGIANTDGKVECEMVGEIMNYAKLKGIDTLDTAINYGNSESCLGEFGVKDWKIITKLPMIPVSCVNVMEWASDQISNSLLSLNVRHLYGVLLHQPSQLFEAKGDVLWSALRKAKESGIVGRIGFSIYNPSELDKFLPFFHPDIVQAPYNIFDRRLETSGWLHRMNKIGIEVHTRSVFLQGLLLMNRDNRPKKFDIWSDLWSAWDAWLASQQITPQQACLDFVMKNPQISKVIVGVDNQFQLEEILSLKRKYSAEFPREFEVIDENLINPSRWSLL